MDEAMAVMSPWDFDPYEVGCTLTWWHGEHDANAPHHRGPAPRCRNGRCGPATVEGGRASGVVPPARRDTCGASRSLTRLEPRQSVRASRHRRSGRPAFVPPTIGRPQEGTGTVEQRIRRSEPRIRSSAQVVKPAPRTLSRWRHVSKCKLHDVMPQGRRLPSCLQICHSSSPLSARRRLRRCTVARPMRDHRGTHVARVRTRSPRTGR